MENNKLKELSDRELMVIMSDINNAVLRNKSELQQLTQQAQVVHDEFEKRVGEEKLKLSGSKYQKVDSRSHATYNSNKPVITY